MIISPYRFALSGYASVILADAPLAYWRLDETAGTNLNDEVGSNDATAVGSPTMGSAGVDGSTAIELDSSASKYATIPSAVALALSGDTSVELWAKWTTGVNAAVFIELYDAASSVNLVLTIGYNDASKIGFGHTTSGSAINWTYDCGSGLNDGDWHHLVGVISGSDRIVYVDGANVTSASIGGNSVSESQIGKGFRAGVPGTYDEVAVYDYALSAAQVLAHYTAGI